MSRTRVNVLSAALLLLPLLVRVAAVGDSDSGSDSEEARVEVDVEEAAADDAAVDVEYDGDSTALDVVEYGDAGSVSVEDEDSVCSRPVTDCAPTGLRALVDDLGCGCGTADGRRD